MTPFKTPFVPPVAVLETPRLRIRVESEEEYTQRFRTGSDAELMAEYGFPTSEAAALHRAKVIGGFSTYETSTVQFQIVSKAQDAVIGSLSFHNWFPAYRRSELGYAITAEALKGQGLMREALPQVLQFGFQAMRLNRIEACINPENTASRKLVARAGFSEEGLLKQHYSFDETTEDSILYSLLREQWSGPVI